MAAPFIIAKGRLSLTLPYDVFKIAYIKLYSTSKRKRRAKDLPQKSNGLPANGRKVDGFVPNTKKGKSVSFQDILNLRRDEALQSVLVRTSNPAVTLQKLQAFGPLEYAGFTSTDRSLILAQYKETRDLHSLLSEGTTPFIMLRQFPLRSRLLCDTNKKRSSKNNRKADKEEMTVKDVQHYPNDRLDISLPPNQSFDDEAIALHACKSLNDLDLRQRFFISALIEDTVKCLLPQAQVTPYGSCLNGFGWWDGDLDMMLSLGPLNQPQAEQAITQTDQGTRFKFMSEIFSTDRQLAQRSLAAIGQILELMPRIGGVSKILNAKVPILRFRHFALEIHCDLSFQAMDSIKMTEFLYLLAMSDPRVQPLMTTLKQWALHHKVTSSGEQRKPTTLGLLCLLIFYLQTRQPSVLPTLRSLQSLADVQNRFYIDDLFYHLPSSPSSIPATSNTESIESLLHGLFEFYASFNFEKDAISIIEGRTFSKPDTSTPLYMENPWCISLNICRNVSQSSLVQFQQSMKHSARAMNDIKGKQNYRKSSTPRLKRLFNQSLVESSVHVNIDSLFDETVSVSGKLEKEKTVEKKVESDSGEREEKEDVEILDCGIEKGKGLNIVR